MKKLMLLLLFTSLSTFIFGQVTSTAFKNAADAATSSWNNKNEKCVEYAKALDNFLSNNASDYDIGSYKFYEYKSSEDFLVHDDYSTNTPISTNGRHIVAVIDGYVFDNHHPKGAAKSTWESKLYSAAGFGNSFPSGFESPKLISNIQSIR